MDKIRAKLININNSVIFINIQSFLVFLFFYWSDLNRPKALFNLGWYQIWYDQSQYYDMLIGISKGNLGHFQYPIGYPFLGFLGNLLFNRDPFLIVDLLFFMIYIHLSFKILNHFFNGNISIIGAIMLSIITVNMFVTPWTTTVSALSFMYIVYLFILKKYNLSSSIIVGFLLGMAFAARIGDIVPVALIFAFYSFYYLFSNKKLFFYGNIISALVSALIIFITIIINYKFSGRIFGYYFDTAMSQGFNWLGIPFKIYGYFINSFTFHNETHFLAIPLLKYSFLFFFTPLGLYKLIRSKLTRINGIFLLTGILGWCVIYIPMVALTGMTLKYGSLHYIKMLLPIFVLLAFYYIEDIGNKNSKNIRMLLSYILVGSIAFFVIWNFKPQQLPLDNVTVSSTINNIISKSAVDNDINTRWDTGKPQQKGIEFMISFPQKHLLNRVQLDTSLSPGGYPRGIDLYYSNDGVIWKKAFNPGIEFGPVINISFDPLYCRYLKLVLTKDEPKNGDWWSIHEIRIWGR